MALENKWVKLISRSYSQMMADISAAIATNIPEITDTAQTEKAMLLASISAGIGEQNNYFADNVALREAFLDFARQFASVAKAAQSEDFRILPGTAATGTLVISIPSGASVDYYELFDSVFFLDNNGNYYYASVIPHNSIGDTLINYNVTQYSNNNTTTAQGTGLPNQKIILDARTLDVQTVYDTSENTYYKVDSLSNATNTHYCFIFEINENGLPQITFGDGVTGFMPINGNTIYVLCLYSNFAGGNIDANTSFTIDYALPDSVTISNPLPFTGGSGIDSIDTIRTKIKAKRAVLGRAVTLQDYANLALLYPGIRTAIAQQTNIRSVLVTVYGNGTAVTDTSGLTSYLQNFALLGQTVSVVNAGLINIIQNWTLNVQNGYSSNIVKGNFINAILAMFNSTNQPINNQIQVSEIYYLAQNMDGVNYATLNNIYAKPVITGSTEITYTITLNPLGNDIAIWKLLFNSGTAYQLFKNGGFVGTFSTGANVVQPEFTLNVTGTYTSGNVFNFTTYPYNESVVLGGNVIGITDSGDITVNTVGGY